MNATETSSDLQQKIRRRGNGHGLGNIAGDELRTLLTDVEELLSSIADITEPQVLRARAKVTSALAEARRELGDSVGTLRQRARLAADTADQYVHGRPWTAVGLAAAIGVIVGIGASAASRR